MTAEETERDQRRLMRVRRELERIQEVEEEKENRKQEPEVHDILEFAENFFNDHEKSPSGTIVGTIKRSKTLEVLGTNDELWYRCTESSRFSRPVFCFK
jgi:hypothetical protein